MPSKKSPRCSAGIRLRPFRQVAFVDSLRAGLRDIVCGIRDHTPILAGQPSFLNLEQG